MPFDPTEPLEFHKLHGSGNDFIFIDNRTLGVDPEAMPDWAVALCRRAFSVGADGLIFLEDTAEKGLDFRWRFFNADGSRAGMCGNASRCAAMVARTLGMAGDTMTFGADVGSIAATVHGDGTVTSQLTPYRDLKLHIPLNLTVDGASQGFTAHFVDTGVPHAVILVDDADAVDPHALGRAVRNHETFAPAGANANFVQVTDRGHMRIRTYERGVEAETFACGTGAVAAAVVAGALDLVDVDAGPVALSSTGGEVLGVELADRTPYLTGGAAHVYTGVLIPAALGITA